MSRIDELNEVAAAVKFKIHAVNSVIGNQRSANNGVFYDTLEEAKAKVKEYLARGDGNHGGFVIMKTIAVFKPVQAPIATYYINDSGLIQELK